MPEVRPEMLAARLPAVLSRRRAAEADEDIGSDRRNLWKSVPLPPPRTTGEAEQFPPDISSSTLRIKPILTDEGPSPRVRSCAPAGPSVSEVVPTNR